MTRVPERLADGRFDCLIVGGGILGCGIARDAALRGLKVALVEREDFASGTSSRSSKLVHGGLRYLEHGAVRLVREACREREALLRAAPHLVRPLPFLLPYRRGQGWPPLWMLRIGLALYDAFAGPTRAGSHRMLDPAELRRREPALAGLELEGGAAYYDAQMDDARLTLEVALDAARAGAVLVNRAPVTGFLRNAGGRVTGARVVDGPTGRAFGVEAGLVVNAAGPWGDAVLRLAGDAGAPVLRPSLGVHLVYGGALTRHALILRAPKDRRVFLVLPWRGLTLIGTTDTGYAGDPAEAAASPGDVAYLLEAATAALPGASIDPGRVMAAFAGVRPLLDSGVRSPSAASREHAVVERIPGLLSVLGGKFTTFRAIAEHAVDRICRSLGRDPGRCPTHDAPLPGAGPVAAGAAPQTPAWSRLTGVYGARAGEVIERAAFVPDGLHAVCPHTWRLRAEAVYAVQEEMATTLDDLLDRRLGLTYQAPCAGLDAARPVAELAAPLLGWSEAEAGRQVAAYRDRVARERAAAGLSPAWSGIVGRP